MEAAKKDSEIEAHMSFDVIRYSQVWEDSRRLCAALEIGPQDTVLSISSSGCNALALLLKGPQKLVACDLSPA
jgi:S-adenosylmethionine-diacylglycerol 3-amino-3-carboxypropyl transferase